VNLSAGLAPLSLVVSNINKPYTFTGAGNLTGASALVKAGSGTLTLSNTGENSFNGGVSILDGTLRLSGAANRLPTNAVVSLADVSTAALNLNGVSQTIGGLTGGGASGGNVALGSANLTVTGPGIFDGQISGGGSLTKSGAGTLTLNAANTYTAGTLVEGGTLVLANNSASSPLRVETNSVLQLGAGTQLPALTATSITNNGTVRLDVTSDSILATPISGNGGLTKVGAGMITIPGANTYTGLTTISVGPLRITNPVALGTADGETSILNDPTARLELTGGITVPEPLRISQKQSAAGAVPCVVNASGTNTLSGPMIATTGGSFWTFQVDTDELIVSGPFTNAATSNTRVIRLRGPAGVGDWRSAIVNQAANLSLTGVTKEETGTWILGGNNTYTGPTVVSDGTLLVNGSISGGTVTVNAGSLGGVGTISVPVTVNGSGTLAPGVGIGKLTVQNTLTLLGRTVMQVSRSGASVTNDQVAGITTLNLGGDLEVNVVGTLTGGEVFKLFTAATITGGFANVYLPDLTAPLGWDTTRLAVDGTLLVTGGTPQPPTLVAAQTNNLLTFSWQGTGFRLQAQTNSLGIGLSSNWADYPGGNVSPVTVTIDPAKPTVFFRLISE
jgi:autotransporter-associated beta strand protein